jgi:hypothetical protein
MWHFLRKVCNLYVFGPHSSHGNTRGRDFSIKLSIFRLSTRVTKYSFTHCVSASFMWTCRLGPSICITLTFFLRSAKCHGSINGCHMVWPSVWYGKIYTLQWLFDQDCYDLALLLHTLTRTVYSLRTRSHDCLSLSVQKDNFTPHTTSFSEALSTLNSNQRTLFLKALVSREGAQLQLKTANTNLHVMGTSHHGVGRPHVSDRGTAFE